MHVCHDVAQLASTTEFHSNSAIPRETAGAGEDEVAHPGQARQCFALCSASDRQPSDLRQSAGNQGGGTVVSKSEPLNHTGSNRDDILQRSAKLHAYNVVICVDTK